MTNLAIDDTKITNFWPVIQENLQAKYGQNVYNNWLSKLNFREINHDRVILAAPTRFVREWIINNYVATIRQLWQIYDERVHSIEIEVDEKLNESTTRKLEEVNAQVTEIFNHSNDDPFEFVCDSRYSFNNFVVGTPNQLAYAAARSVAESNGPQPGCNPLFLYGAVGLGKTHLMHSIANYIRSEKPERKVIYLSAEKFMFLFIRALRNKNIVQFKEKLRSVDVLMIDDVQFICGKDSTQEEFFHTLNDLIDNQRQIVISCDRSPSDLEDIEERIKSRLGWGLVADVHSTNYELRLGILQSKIEEYKVNVPKEVLEFLASKIASNVRELEGALNKIIAYSNFTGKAITLESTHNILKDLLRSTDKVVTIEDIQKKVAEFYNIRLSDITSARRIRSIVRPRQVAMYLAKSLTTKSLTDIGKLFGGKDHTTIMHAIKQIEKLIQEDSELAENIDLITRKIEN